MSAMSTAGSPVSPIIERLAVQSFCYRNHVPHARLLDSLALSGFDKLELCFIHVDPLTERDFAGVIRLYRDSGIRLTAFGVHIFTANEAETRKVFEFAKLAEMDIITCHLARGSLDIVERCCEEYGIRAALHNHGRRHEHGSVQAIGELFAQSSPNIGLCLDSAWMIDMWENPVEVARKFRDRLYGVHLKDYVYKRDGFPEDIMPGEGNLDLGGFLGYLVDSGYEGHYTIEYEGNPDNPAPSLRQCREIISRTALDIANRRKDGSG